MCVSVSVCVCVCVFVYVSVNQPIYCTFPPLCKRRPIHNIYDAHTVVDYFMYYIMYCNLRYIENIIF